MNIAIIGAGFTGLSAAYQLQKKGHKVTVFEKDSQPGGLAIGYQEKNWEWSLEKHYHHWFTNDKYVLNLAEELHFPVLIKRINTSVFVDSTFYQLDSPLKVLQFPKLSVIERLRMATALGFLRFNPWWKPLEKVKAVDILPKIMGEDAWKTLWWPQLHNKMGEYANDISLVWFWTRINKRTPSVAYPEGGFLHFAEFLVKHITKNGGNVHFSTETLSIQDKGSVNITVRHQNKEKTHTFDKVIVTLPSFLFLKLAPELPDSYKKRLIRLKGLGATNMVLRLKKPFFPNNTYWLSICDNASPIMALVEHTNFMDKKHYNNEHLLYIGNYMPADSKKFSLDKENLLDLYDPYLKKINPTYKKSLIGYEVFRAPFAQPIVPTNYSKLLPPMETPFPNVILANIEQVYPWDRGTNYAVELGEKAAKLISNDYF